MSAIFISHSSADSRIAAAIREKLAADGHRSIFLDFDPADGIPAGRDWEQELYRQLRTCQAVIVLCSESSMSSMWCFAEITHAKALGKQIFPAKIGPCTINTVLTSRQVLDFSAGSATQVYDRLRRGLKEAGLDPASAFDWDGSRPPYPGLLAFDEADAAIFFGREIEIQQGLELLNRRNQFGGARMVIVLGASGSGKSSLVRAGFIPRLRRSADRWIVIDPFRPREDPLHELAAVLCSAFARQGETRRIQSVREGLAAGEYAGGLVLNKFASELREASGRRDATVLITVDQMEELVGPAAPAGARELLVLLQAALAERGTALMVMGTLRSDFLGELQNHPAMREARFDTLPVGPMPAESLASVIEGPARKAGLELEDGLTQALIADTEAENALPLLAFTLRELYEKYGGDGRLTIDEYAAKLGGLSGSIAKAADAVFTAEPLSDAQSMCLRSAFLAMVRVNEAGQFARQLARWSDIPENVRPVLERFTKARLLVIRGEGTERVVEVAHEAMFRAWDRLKTWLAEDREFLLWRKRLEDAVGEWRRLKHDRSTLLKGPALSEARLWFERQRGRMNQEEAKFVSDSIEAANRERRQKRVLVVATMAVLAVVAVGGVALWWTTENALRAKDAAEAKTREAVQAKLKETVQLSWEALNDAPCEAALAGTTLSGGVRSLYCSVSRYLNIRRVEELSGMPIFLSGPHKLRPKWNATTFGHYNPKLVEWARDHLLPKRSKVVQDVYNKFAQRTARVFLIAYLRLQEKPTELAELANEYRGGSAVKLEDRYWQTGAGLDEDPDIKTLSAGFQRGRGASDETSAYVFCAATGFWARRQVDGTLPIFYDGLRKTLKEFDPEFLGRRAP